MLGPDPNPYLRIWPLDYHPEGYTDRGLRELCDPETGQLVVNDRTVNPGDMLHKSAAGAIRVLVPVSAAVGTRR